MTILLVEDQTNYAFIVQEMLHQEAVATVASVQRLDQALYHLVQQTPELILAVGVSACNVADQLRLELAEA